jgi:hypothetical protein
MKKKICFSQLLIVALLIAVPPITVLAASIQLNWQENTEPDLQGYNVYYGTDSRAYGPPVSVTAQTSYLLSGLAEATIYYIAISATDNSGNESGYSSEVSIKTSGEESITPTDMNAPVVKITSPTPADIFDTDQENFSLSGNASDNIGIASIRWENATGQNGIAEGTTSWTAKGLRLSEGRNVITIRALDASGNEGVDRLTVDYTPADKTSPQIVILSPSPSEDGSPWQVTEAVLNISGSATDDREVAKVSWSANGNLEGAAIGTERWSVAGISLAEGLNTISIQALDASGNIGTASLAITYTAPNQTTPTADSQIITDVSAASDRTYYVKEGLVDGNPAYVDRTYEFGNLPGQLIGSAYIMTANDDKLSEGQNFLGFNAGHPVTVYVAHDDRITVKPAWLAQFADTGLNLSTDVPMSLFSRKYAAGTITLGGNGGTNKSSMYTVVVSKNTEMPLAALEVTNLSAISGEPYQKHNRLEDGNRVYIDRNYSYGDLPSELRGCTYIMTANDDKHATNDHFLSFQVNRPVTVYIAHDNRITSKPTWLKIFTDTGLDLSSDVPMSIFARSFASGSVVLGGNGGDSDTSMYAVAIGD